MSHYTDHPKIWAKAAAEADLTITLPGGVPMCFRRIPGTAEVGMKEGFLMGSRGGRMNEEPPHRVIIPQAFYLGTFLVTQGQWRAVAGEVEKLREMKEPAHFKEVDHPEDRPVEWVSWYDCQDFCGWLGAAWGGLGAKWKGEPPVEFKHPQVCLPAEAGWEWACRGITEQHSEGGWSEYHNGDGDAALAEVGWFDGNSNSSTQPVGKLKPNVHGLYDMHGNVDEWCADIFDRNAYRKRADGWEAEAWTLDQARDDADYWSNDEQKEHAHRVLRGGSWFGTARWCRSAFRRRDGPAARLRFYGFRVCLVPGPASQQGGEAKGAQVTGVPGAPGAADPFKELKRPAGNPSLE